MFVPVRHWLNVECIATTAVLIALFGTLAFGGRLDQFHAIIVVIVLPLGLAGISEMRKRG